VDLRTNEPATLEVGGRHDAFPLPRALVVVEGMVAITIVDALLRAGRLPEKL
jgi:chorismate synthase